MTKALFLLFVFLVPISAIPFSKITNSEEMWWCQSCGLAYPVSQKWCLNKDCSLFKQKK